MRLSSSSFGRCSSRRSNCSRAFEQLEDSEDDSGEHGIGGAMLPIFLNDLRRNDDQDTVEVTLELEEDSIVVCSVTPTTTAANGEVEPEGFLARSLSVTSRIRRKFPWLKSQSSSRTSMSDTEERNTISARDARKIRAGLQRTKSSAQQALKGLRFINKSTAKGASHADELCRNVEARFDSLAKDGLLAREDFGECIGN